MDPKAVNEKLVYYFRPLTFPVAVKLLASADELPEKAKVPTRDFGHKIMTCQAMAMARRHGRKMAQYMVFDEPVLLNLEGRTYLIEP